MALSRRALKRRVETHLDDLARRFGVGSRTNRFKTDMSTHESPFDVFIQRPRHEHEGTGLLMHGVNGAIDADGVIGEDALRSLEHQAATRARVLRRAAALKAYKGNAPEWAFDMHPLALGMIRNAGFAFGQIIGNAPSYGSHSLTLAIEDKMAASADIELQIDSARCSAGTIDIDIHEVHDDDQPSISLYDSMGTCNLIIHDVRIPQTVLSTLAGKPLREVIRHHIMDTLPDLHILDAEDHVRGTSISIDSRHVPLATAPDGIDTRWRTLPASNR